MQLITDPDEEDDALGLVISPLLDPGLMVAHMMFVVVPTGQLVPSRDPVHLTGV